MKKCQRKACKSARARILELEREVQNLQMYWARDRAKLADAKNIAFKEFVQHGNIINDGIDQLMLKLAELLGKELMPSVQKILNHATKDGKIPLDFSMSAPYSDKKCTVLSAEIKPLRYNIAMYF